MNYETKADSLGREVLQQELVIKDRKALKLTGVKKIDSLNETEFLINTNLGDLLIRGEELEMQHLDIEKGHLWICGYFYSLEYLEEKVKKNKNGFVGKLFK